jgi:hypothetical protein
VHGLINGIVCVVHALDRRESIVKCRFLETFAVSIDIVKPAIGVDGDEIRCDTNVGPVLAVQLMEPQMTVTFEAMVELYPRCYGCQNGAIDTAEGMDKAVVESKGEGLSSVRLF